MIFKQSLSLIFLVTMGSNIFAMEIIKGKKYRTINGDIVQIQGTCKEIWGIDGLIEAVGKNMGNPAILGYVRHCAIASGKIGTFCRLGDKIIPGDKEAFKACIDPKYFGEFYYTTEDNFGICVHQSWFTMPIIEDEEDENE